MDTHGYITDFLCYDHYFTWHNPHWLRYVAAAHGKAFPINNDFTYCEVGSGHGLTLAINAAANPKAQFYGLDINEGHYDSMVNYSKLLGIDNLHPRLADIMQPQDLPKMDFIVAHGFISWVVPEVMQGMYEFIQKHLKPGGLVMISYDTLPGCAHREQIAHIMQRYMRDAPDETIGIQEGIKHLVWLFNSGSNMFKMLTLLESEFKKLGSLQNVAHQYGNGYYAGQRFDNVNRMMNDIDLQYISNVDIHRSIPSLCIKKDLVDTFKGMDSIQREIVMQELLSSPFTISLFQKPMGGTPVNPNDITFTNALPRNWMHPSGNTPLGDLKFPENVGKVILDELDTPKKLSSLSVSPAITQTLIALNRYILPVADATGRQTVDPKSFMRTYLQNSTEPFVPVPSSVLGSGVGVPSEIACVIVSGGLNKAEEFAKECDKEWSSKVTKDLLPDVKKYRDHLKRLGAWKR